MVILTALVAGERDPAVMAEMAYSKLRNRKPELAESLIGHFDDHHALLIGGMLQRLAQVEASLKACDGQIAEIAPWQHQFELLQTMPGIGVKTAQVFIAETGADMSGPDPPPAEFRERKHGELRERRTGRPRRWPRSRAPRVS